MKRTFLFFFSFLFVSFSLFSEVKWFKGDLQKSLDSAKKGEKIIMIDFYTDWCMPCKILDKTVWQDDEVGKKIKDMPLIPLKLDAEKEGAVAAKKYSVKVYPTILFIGSDGKEIIRILGFSDKDTILKKIEDACKNKEPIEVLQEKYEKNKSDFESGLSLVQKLLSSEDESSNQKAMTILKEIYEKDLDNKNGARDKAFALGLSASLNQLSDKLWTIFFSSGKNAREKEIKVDVFGLDKNIDFTQFYKFQSFLYDGYIKEKSKELLPIFKEIYNKAVQLKDSNVTMDEESLDRLLGFFSIDAEKWGETGDTFADFCKEFANGEKLLNEVAWYNYKMQRNLEESLELAKKCCEISNEAPDNLDTLAHIYMSLGQKEKAFEIEKRAIAKKPILEKTLKYFEKDELDQLAEGVEPKNKNLKRAIPEKISVEDYEE
jgi:thiol-disulfide isomerase/thioredoxin